MRRHTNVQQACAKVILGVSNIISPEKIRTSEKETKRLALEQVSAMLNAIQCSTGKAEYGTLPGYGGLGRFYGRNRSIVATWYDPKVTRLAMIKERHFGADIEGCHYATVISHVRSTHITHTRVETARKLIQDQQLAPTSSNNRQRSPEARCLWCS